MFEVIMVGLPLLNALICLFFGRYISKKGLKILLTIYFSLLIVFSLVINYSTLVLDNTIVTTVGQWIRVGGLTVSWTFLFDKLTSIMISIITLAILLIHYSYLDKIENDPHTIRFIGCSSIFIFNMLVLVSAGNFVQLFLGWAGVGLSSYLLINFWFTRNAEMNKATVKALIINLVSNFFLFITTIITLVVTGDGSFLTVEGLFTHDDETQILYFFNGDPSNLTWITVGLIVATMGKSAQIGLHTWSSSAIEGPIPLSALIHAVTLGTASIFLLIRCSPILLVSDNINTVITTITICSILLVTLLVIINIKKIIVYFTRRK